MYSQFKGQTVYSAHLTYIYAVSTTNKLTYIYEKPLYTYMYYTLCVYNGFSYIYVISRL